MSSTARTHPRRSRDDRLDLVFTALADRKRRAILARLGRGPARVTDLAAPFDISLPAVSRHLRVLERAKLIRRTIDGRVHECSLEPHALAEAQRWLAERRAFWEETLAALAEHVEGEGG